MRPPHDINSPTLLALPSGSSTLSCEAIASSAPHTEHPQELTSPTKLGRVCKLQPAYDRGQVQHRQIGRSPLLIARGNPSELFEAINQTLDFMSLPIEAAVKWSGAMLTAFAGNRQADAVSPQVSSNRPAALGLIADEPFRTPLGAARPATCHGALGQQGDQDERLMTLPRREDEGHGLALALGPAMDCGTKAALAAP
jgi:hypothetical protein